MAETERKTSLTADDAKKSSSSSCSLKSDDDDEDDIDDDDDDDVEEDEEEVRVTVEAVSDVKGTIVVSFFVVPRSLFCASGLTSVDTVSVTHLPSTSRDDDELE